MFTTGALLVQTRVWSGLAKWNILDKVIAKVQFGAESLDLRISSGNLTKECYGPELDRHVH
jgi:hypothetical protein